MHYLTLVFVTQEEAGNGIHDLIQKRLEPYHTSNDFPQHIANCFCRGRVAAKEAYDLAHNELWPVDRLLAALQQFEHGGITFTAQLGKASDEVTVRAEELFAGRPDRWSPDPDCETCHGTGHYDSTENSMGYWSNYAYGGRFSPLYPGHRWLVPVRKITAKLKNYLLVQKVMDKCGYSVELKEKINDKLVDPTPFAVLSGGGIWHSHKNLRKAVQFYTEKSLQEWRERFYNVCKSHRDCLAVICDMKA